MTEFVKSAFNFLSGSAYDRPENNLVGKFIDIENNTYKVKKIVAQGGYATVFEASCNKSNKIVAIKRLLSYDKETYDSIREEINIFKSLNDHPNIIRFIEAGLVNQGKSKISATEFLIVTEFCKHGQLSSFLPVNHSNEPFSTKTILQIFYQTCLAVQHMHSLKPPIIHRDLKIENLLISDTFTIKLCDFGSASCETFEINDSWTINQRGLLQEKLEKVTTPMYRSPEMIDLFLNFPINQAVDIWALGCVLFYLVCTYHPFEDPSKLAILNVNYRLPDLDRDHLIFLKFIRQLLLLDPRQRPKIGTIVSDLFTTCHSKNIPITGSIPLIDEVKKRSYVTTDTFGNAHTSAEISSKNPANDSKDIKLSPKLTPKRPAPMPPSDQAQSNAVPKVSPITNDKEGESVFNVFKSSAGNLIRNASSKLAEVMQNVPGIVQNSSVTSSVDLNYITSRLAVMSYPNETASTMYGPKNSMLEVQATLDTQHNLNYSVFNVSPFQYETSQAWFGGRFLHRPFSTHTAPSLVFLTELCVNARLWLAQHQNNVCIVHCTDGRACSALLIAAILCFCRVFDNPSSALRLFTYRRANPRLNASQRRNGCRPYLEVHDGEKLVYTTYQDYELIKSFNNDDAQVEFHLNGLQVGGDVTICIYHARSSYTGKGRVPSVKICQFQFHTGFVKQDQTLLEFSKIDLDHLDPTGGHQGFTARYSDQLMVSLELMCSPNERPRLGSFLNYPWETMLPKCDPAICFGNQAEMLEIITDFGSYESSPIHDKQHKFSEDIELLDGHTMQQPSVPEESQTVWRSSHHLSTRESFDSLKQHETENEAFPPTSNQTFYNHSDDLNKNYSQFETQSDFANFYQEDVADLLGLHKENTAKMEEHFEDLNQNTGGIEDWYRQFQFTDDSSESFNHNDIPLDDDFLTFHPDLGNKTNTTNNPFDIPVKNAAEQPDFLNFNQTPFTETVSTAPNKDPFADLGSIFESIPTTKNANASQNFNPFHTTPSQDDSTCKQTTSTPPNQNSNTNVKNTVDHQPKETSTKETARPRPKVTPSASSSRPFVGQDAFSDLLNGFGASNNPQPGYSNRTIREMQREKEVQNLDPEALKVRCWVEGKENNLRAQLCTLHLILWEEARYNSVSMTQLVNSNQVKKAYRNAARAVHPDKFVQRKKPFLRQFMDTIRPEGNGLRVNVEKWLKTPHESMAKHLFIELNNAMLYFEKQLEQKT